MYAKFRSNISVSGDGICYNTCRLPRWMRVSTGEVMLHCSTSSASVTEAAAATGLQFHLSYWNWYWHSTRPSLAPSSTHGIASGLRRHTSSCCSTNPGNRPHISPADRDTADDDSIDCRCAPGRLMADVDDIAVWRPIYLISTNHRQCEWILKVKSFPEPQGHEAALISVSLALSRTPAEAARPRIRG